MAIKPTGPGLRLTPSLPDLEPKHDSTGEKAAVAVGPHVRAPAAIDDFVASAAPSMALPSWPRQPAPRATGLSAMLAEPRFMAALVADILEKQLRAHQTDHGAEPFAQSLLDAGASLSQLEPSERAAILAEHPRLGLALEQRGVTFGRRLVAVGPNDLDQLYATQGSSAVRARSVAEQAGPNASVESVLEVWRHDEQTRAWSASQPEAALRRWGRAILTANAGMKRLLGGESA